LHIRRGIEQYFEDENRDGRRAKGGDHTELDAHREEDLDRMKASARRDVDVEVGVMHAV
jgi:hypothetical protein